MVTIMIGTSTTPLTTALQKHAWMLAATNPPIWEMSAIVSAPTSWATFFTHYSWAYDAEMTGFPVESEHWCRRQARRKTRMTQPPHRRWPIRGSSW
jgi:hypothetical protein